ncbi:MAG: alanyl-tRNA editing protein [Nanoarchaeota archaeon]|nr:alanyl-tRNA editing protein [Nanoarchaeota archaeon]
MEALYLTDSYLKEFTSTVEEVNDEKFIVLNQTAFYPAGGGQPHDEGIMVNERGEEFKVVYVGKFSGKISHEVDKKGLKVGDKVECKINWDRRYKLMKTHTATHILSEVFYQGSRAIITGGQMGLDRSRMDFSLENYDLEKIKAYIGEANKIIEKDLSISIEFLPKEEAMKLPKLSKLAKGISEELKEVRIVSIGDFDIQADGGTHVKSTREIGKIEFLKCDNKGKNNRRIYYKLSDD